jgi:hypothetical protein
MISCCKGRGCYRGASTVTMGHGWPRSIAAVRFYLSLPPCIFLLRLSLPFPGPLAHQPGFRPRLRPPRLLSSSFQFRSVDCETSAATFARALAPSLALSRRDSENLWPIGDPEKRTERRTLRHRQTDRQTESHSPLGDQGETNCGVLCSWGLVF